MQPEVQAYPPFLQAGQEPQLPQRPGGIKLPARQLLARPQQLGLVAGSGDRMDPDVICDVEEGGVDPQRPAQPQPRPVQQLPGVGDQV